MARSFGERLSRAIEANGNLCVGIDPHPGILNDWGLDDSAEGIREFSLVVLEAAVDQVAVVKPQVAFFERFGAAGYQVLEQLMEAARAAGLLVIADAKRGDIGSTMRAYTSAWLSRDAPLQADALTVSPYLGIGALEECFSAALEQNAGLFCLVATSNPEGRQLQRARVESGGGEGNSASQQAAGADSVAATILSRIEALNAIARPQGERIGSLGAVIGATVRLSDFGLDELVGDESGHAPILAPGFGHQGAALNEVRSIFGSATSRVLCNLSRDLYVAGAKGVEARIVAAKRELAGE